MQETYPTTAPIWFSESDQIVIHSSTPTVTLRIRHYDNLESGLAHTLSVMVKVLMSYLRLDYSNKVKAVKAVSGTNLSGPWIMLRECDIENLNATDDTIAEGSIGIWQMLSCFALTPLKTAKGFEDVSRRCRDPFTDSGLGHRIIARASPRISRAFLPGHSLWSDALCVECR